MIHVITEIAEDFRGFEFSLLGRYYGLFKVSHAKKTKKMKNFYTFLFSRNINIKYVN